MVGLPFQMVPDCRFLFNSIGHRRAVFRLLHGLQQQAGFVVITGEIGAGKTMLVESLTEQLGAAEYRLARVMTTHLATNDLLRLVAAEFGVSPGAGKMMLLRRLEDRLRALRAQGQRPLLIVDEAQALSVASLERLWMISNLSEGGQSLVQIILIGQPGFRETLARQELYQLHQRVVAFCHLGPLGAFEVRPYVEHRLAVVGWSGRPEWEDAAFERIYHHTGGIPRRINRLCARVILHGALEEKPAITAAMVDDAAGLDAELNLGHSVSPGLANFGADTVRLDAFLALVMAPVPVCGSTVPGVQEGSDPASTPFTVRWVVAALVMLGTVTVASQTMSFAAVLGPTGLDVTGNGLDFGGENLRGLLGDLLGASTPEAKPLTLGGSFGVQELATDNAYQIHSPRRADVVTSLSPQITLTGQSQLLQANVNYAPSIQLYAATPRQNQIAQDFSGQMLITAKPDTLFLELHGYGTQQSSTGGLSQSAVPYYSNQNRTNTIALEASPYITHRFGGDGTLQAGYVFNYTGQDTSSSTALANALFVNPLLNQLPVNGTTRSNKEYATFTTGENLGRFNVVSRVEDTRYSSSGNAVLAGAHQSLATTDVGYGINRAIALLGTLGYEDIAYSGQPPTRIQDVVWSGGLRLTPNENSSITLKYGHKDGFDSFGLSSSYALTSRMRLFLSYSEGLTSSQQEIQDNLDNSTTDQFGNTISTVTGAPTVIADQLLAPQNALYRLRRTSATAVSTYDRDVLSLSIEQESRALVASGAGLAGSSDHGLSANFNWSHTITPELSGTASLRYARTVTQTPVSQLTQAIGLTLQANYAINPSLTCTVQYFVTNQSSNQGGQSFLQNALLIGLRKDL